MAESRKKNMVIVWVLAFAVVLMFFFGYALVPIYNTQCNVLGINGKTNPNAAQNFSYIDRTRKITVQFLATNNANLPWEFRPGTKKIEIHPGQDIKILYYAKNKSGKTMTVQAVPSVATVFS